MVQYPMPRRKDDCPLCGGPKGFDAEMCKPCRDLHPYERTAEHRQGMSKLKFGRKNWWPSASTRPDVAANIAAWWTPERRAEQREIVLTAATDPKLKSRLSHPGEKNPNWQGGRRQLPYAPGWTRALRRQVVERDGGCCQDCGSTERLHVHHVDFGKDNNEMDNLITLCHKYHFVRHAEHNRAQRTK